MTFSKGCSFAHVIPEKIKKWLTEEELSFIQPIGEPAQSTLFNYLVSLPSDTKVNLVQSSHRKDSICVSSVISFSDDQTKKLRKKQNSEKTKIFSKIRFKLAPVDVALDIKDNKIIASHIIYYDGLTKDRLFKTITDLEKACTLMNLAVQKAL
ncbi:MAG: DUF2299 family protein [Candidatus Bathyarchaeum tardum]|nr:MAG: DUF2299 family protein [Candidatus Bathyarchaeum tardum]